jgi:tetratricopeptide (TPR) repeat protein
MRAMLPLAVGIMITAWPATTWADDKSDCRTGKDADVRIKACSALIQSDAKDATAYHNRGAALQSKGDLDKALADYDQAISLKPDYASAYDSRARIFVAKGDYTRAVADVTKAGELAPKVTVRPKTVPSATKSAEVVAKPAAAPAKPKPAPKPTVVAKKQPQPNWPDWAPKEAESRGD